MEIYVVKKFKVRKENRCVEGWCFSLERANVVSGFNFKIEMVFIVGVGGFSKLFYFLDYYFFIY